MKFVDRIQKIETAKIRSISGLLASVRRLETKIWESVKTNQQPNQVNKHKSHTNDNSKQINELLKADKLRSQVQEQDQKEKH